MMKIYNVCSKTIEFSFYALFFLVPLILTPLNYELFEYNKMMLVYALTTIIVGTWLIKMVASRQIIFKRTPLDIPILIFFVSQLLSTLFSIDPHVSLFGYYSRFHGGLLSTLSYILLYYALVSNISKNQVVRFLKISLLSALVVSIYGILEHFGIDKDIWVQDVQNRVFSTLGQPNWLAAWLVALLPLAMAFALIENIKNQKYLNFAMYFYYLLSTIYYLCLLYTKSRSGLLGFGVAYLIFWSSAFFLNRPNIRIVLRPFTLFTIFYLLFTIVVGTPWTPPIQNLLRQRELPTMPTVTGPALETGGTESGEIRRIVWKGAIDIARHYPLFGTGVETFAFAYYQFRPKEHNLVSEWDFLYNKAHNEYLNYAATTGFVGLGSYLLLIGWFLVWSLKEIKKIEIEKLRDLKQAKPSLNILMSQYLNISLLAGYASILITNFFGFSVVPVALYFWLIPAMMFVLTCPSSLGVISITPPRCNLAARTPITNYQLLITIFILFFIFYFLFFIFRFWYADTRFNRAYQFARASHYKEAYEPYHQAINLNPGEPFYRDELSYTAAVLAVAAFEQKQASLSAQLTNEALYQSKIALTTSPSNVNFWKTATKVFYALSSIEEKYNEQALEALLTAQKLAPTDAKISYNLGLLYGRVGNAKMAIKTLEDTVALKPNYQDARYALALYYNEAGKKQEAIAQLKYILEKISTQAAEVKEKLKEWGVK